MANNVRKRNRDTSRSEDRGGGIGTLVSRQLVAAIICFVVVCGMHNSENASLRNCADAFGRALRFDADWEENVKSAAAWFWDRLPGAQSDERDNTDRVQEDIAAPPQSSLGGEITFQ